LHRIASAFFGFIQKIAPFQEVGLLIPSLTHNNDLHQQVRKSRFEVKWVNRESVEWSWVMKKYSALSATLMTSEPWATVASSHFNVQVKIKNYPVK
jgi:hypothetical protein